MRVTRLVLLALACITLGVSGGDAPKRAGGDADAKPAPADEKSPRFAGILFTPGRSPFEMTAAFGEFGLGGPRVDALKPLPKGIRHVAVDPATKQMYGLTTHQVYQVDPAKGAPVELKLPANIPRLSWPCGLAFDTKRNRLVMVSLGGVGHLYALDPKTGTWALVSDMNNLDLAGLAYDPAADRLMGLYQRFGGPAVPILGIFNADGAQTDAIELTDPALPKTLGRMPQTGPPVQLVMVNGNLAILTPDRIFSVDLKTKKVTVTWARGAAPA